MLLTEITVELLDFPIVFCMWWKWGTAQWKMPITWQFADPNWKPYNTDFFAKLHVRSGQLEELRVPPQCGSQLR